MRCVADSKTHISASPRYGAPTLGAGKERRFPDVGHPSEGPGGTRLNWGLYGRGSIQRNRCPRGNILQAPTNILLGWWPDKTNHQNVLGVFQRTFHISPLPTSTCQKIKQCSIDSMKKCALNILFLLMPCLSHILRFMRLDRPLSAFGNLFGLFGHLGGAF